MKTRVSANSVEAFQELNLGKRQEQVLRVIRETGSISSKGIAFALKLKINQVQLKSIFRTLNIQTKS